jgi:hypothetical protein
MYSRSILTFVFDSVRESHDKVGSFLVRNPASLAMPFIKSIRQLVQQRADYELSASIHGLDSNIPCLAESGV